MKFHKRYVTGIIALAMISVLVNRSEAGAKSPRTSYKESNMWTIEGTPLYAPTLESRAQTKEDVLGEKGKGGMAGGGRKGAACHAPLKDGETYEFLNVKGPGCVRHIWITTPPGNPQLDRNLILRFYWDGQKIPSVEAPLADFFGVAHGRRAAFSSRFVTMGEGRGLNCYFPMPFAKGGRATVTNDSGQDLPMFFYQVDYTVGDEVNLETPRFHAQFRRMTRTELRKDFVLLDGVRGKGRFLGCVVGLRTLCPYWWGEGEMKMYIDGDKDYPTICGTGSEDYVCSAWGLGQFQAPDFGAPFMKENLVSFYRWHAMDPVYFHKDIRVTLQQLGGCFMGEAKQDQEKVEKLIAEGLMDLGRPISDEKIFLLFERADDVCSTAFWYQTLPTQPFPEFPNRELRSAFIEKREGE